LVNLLREEILLKVQKNPEIEAYNEMFIWYYLQRKEFSGAVIQAKALDKKTGGKGKRLLEIGDVCVSNKDYSAAIKAFDYVVEIGDKSPYYHYAVQQKLEIQFLKVTEQKSYKKEELIAIETDYLNAISTLGKSNKTVNILERLAKIQAFYLDKANDAEQLMENTIEIPGLTRADIARLKVLLGDILVVKGDIWEASLLYMQVEKEFSEDVIGHEAKFKNAKVFYYDGEFDYAKAQLDVLKASTSKLIANNAMQLSLLLQDNLGIDTTLAPVQMYANADLLLQQNKYESAIAMLDSLENRYPFHSLVDEVLFKKAEIYEGMQNWTKAIQYYTVVLEDYKHDILADDAAYRIAEIYYNKLGDKEKAMEHYRLILFEFGGSLYTADARKKFRILSGDGI
jgi:tetratricopeptide (TPR) repeat protein